MAYFLLAGDMINGRHWGVQEASIPKNIQSFIGRPFVVTSNDFITDSPYGRDYHHPNISHFIEHSPELVADLDPNDFDDVIDFQKPFRIGQISDVVFDAKDQFWKAVIKKDKVFEGKQFPPFCSPALFQDDMLEADEEMTKWRGVHLAGLMDKPAYGNIALMEGTCNGTLGNCKRSLVGVESLLKTELKLNTATILSDDNTIVDKVPIFGKRKKKLLMKKN